MAEITIDVEMAQRLKRCAKLSGANPRLWISEIYAAWEDAKELDRLIKEVECEQSKG